MAALVALILAVIASFVPRRHYVMDYYANSQLLWNSDRALLVVGVETIGWAPTPLALGLEHARRLLGDASLPQAKLGEWLLLFDLTREGARRHEFRNTPSGLRFAPHGNELIGIIGCPRGPCPIWKLALPSLERTSVEEALKIRSSFTQVRELFAREGWTETGLTFADEPAQAAVDLHGQRLVIKYRLNRVTRSRQIWLERAGAEPYLLTAFNEQWREVDDVEYQALANERSP